MNAIILANCESFKDIVILVSESSPVSKYEINGTIDWSIPYHLHILVLSSFNSQTGGAGQH